MKPTMESMMFMPPVPADGLSGIRDARRRRAAIAQRLMDAAGAAAGVLDWDTLEQAPAWLALREADFITLQCRIGAVACAPMMRLWIDGPRLNAARVLLGAAVLDELLALPDAAMPRGGAQPPRIEAAADVAPQLKRAGAAVLLAALPPGPLRHVLGIALAPALAASMTIELAETLIARAQALGRTARREAAEAAHA